MWAVEWVEVKNLGGSKDEGDDHSVESQDLKLVIFKLSAKI